MKQERVFHMHQDELEELARVVREIRVFIDALSRAGLANLGTPVLSLHNHLRWAEKVIERTGVSTGVAAS